MSSTTSTTLTVCSPQNKSDEKTAKLPDISNLAEISLCENVIRSGFEPETHSLEGCCSIQLSYQTIKSGAKLNKNWEIAKFYTLNLT